MFTDAAQDNPPVGRAAQGEPVHPVQDAIRGFVFDATTGTS
jgi:hypothetical protein